MADDYLSQGIEAVKAGNKQEARRLLDKAIRADPNDVRTWGWFYNVCENDNERLRCIKEVLRIDPNNENAKKKYDELIGLGFQTPSVIPQTARTTDFKNAKGSQSVENQKGRISTIEWIIIGVLGGGAILTVVVIGILFLFNLRLPAVQIPTPLILTPTLIEPSPTFPANKLRTFPTLVIPTMVPFPTFASIPTDTPQPTVTSGPSFIPQTQQLGPIHDTERDTYFSLEIAVNDVKWLTSDKYDTPKSGNIYLIVYLKVKNLGPGSAQSVGSIDFQILDSNRLVHDHVFISSAESCQLDYVDMLPNGTFEGCDAFEVPRSGKLEFIYAPYKNDPLSPGRYLSITVRQN